MKKNLYNTKNERNEVLKNNFYNKYESDELLKNSLLYKYDNVVLNKEKFYTAKYDRVFKSIFCNEEDTRLLRFLLSKILDRNVEKIIFLRNELEVKNIYDKSKIVDILALVDDEYVHIELNIVSDNKYAHIRNYIYFSEIFSKKTRRGDKYGYKTPLYLISTKRFKHLFKYL